MSKIVLLDGVRTPIGKFKGGLSNLSAQELGVHVVEELLRRFPQALMSDGVVMGQVVQAGQGQNPARQVAIRAGIENTTPALTLNSVCIASMESIADATRRLERKEGNMYLVGGFESMTNAPHVSNIRSGMNPGSVEFIDSMMSDGLWCALSDQSMGVLSDVINKELNISRDDQDLFAEMSQSRASSAQEEGRLAEEIIKIESGINTIEYDECIRAGTTFEKLKKLKPAFTNDGTITAGNSSQLSDGASAGIITNIETCERIGADPLAYIVDWSNIAGDVSLHLKPAAAIDTLLKKNSLKVSDIDLFEINEAFASVVIATQRKLGIPNDIVNVNGGAIAIGHPLGASGFRLVLTLVKELKRRGGGRGIATLCGGGGQGMAILVEVDNV